MAVGGREEETPRLLEIAFFLLERWPEGVKVKNKYGMLPIHYACQIKTATLQHFQSLVEPYPEGVKVTTKNGRQLPLHIACFDAPPDVVQYLIEKYPESINIVDGAGWLPLHVVAINSTESIPSLGRFSTLWNSFRAV